jgi:hypothetical protein
MMKERKEEQVLRKPDRNHFLVQMIDRTIIEVETAIVCDCNCHCQGGSKRINCSTGQINSALILFDMPLYLIMI